MDLDMVDIGFKNDRFYMIDFYNSFDKKEEAEKGLNV